VELEIMSELCSYESGENKVCSHVSGGLPWGVNLVVLLASFILVTAIIIASCGGVIRLPWYLGGFELSGRRPQERITAGPQVLL
jgi:hypothetical protein